MSSSTPSPKIPSGWTDGPGYMHASYYWADRNSIKTMLQDEYGIPNVKPVITRTRESGPGDVMFLLESTASVKDELTDNVEERKTYYVWNGVADIVCRIEGQMELTDIYKVIEGNRGYLGRLDLTEVFPLGARNSDD